jgi:hypothetical protein
MERPTPAFAAWRVTAPITTVLCMRPVFFRSPAHLLNDQGSIGENPMHSWNGSRDLFCPAAYRTHDHSGRKFIATPLMQ